MDGNEPKPSSTSFRLVDSGWVPASIGGEVYGGAQLGNKAFGTSVSGH